ncbi:N-acetyltransferase GCN5 [Bifidobacterium sp. DSM 109957]|uniref:N-acetyltransferase GCN5 n=2 Tax=Bifidobacterium oedipodis TaxID=2675322 RepID=A0A7Y0ERB7_9BIFI|nr:N-acetyltransferase GCN5 [Bifidobacterium sp. DSM 109957]
MRNVVTVSVLEAYDDESLLRSYLDTFTDYYPDFDDWFVNKVQPNLGKSRWILIARMGNEVAGVCIIKATPAENKICALRVFDGFRHHGVGTSLVQYAIDQLGDPQPLVTVPEEFRSQYATLFRKFGFRQMAIYRDYYRSGKSEYAFNGFLNESDHSSEARKSAAAPRIIA